MNPRNDHRAVGHRAPGSFVFLGVSRPRGTRAAGPPHVGPAALPMSGTFAAVRLSSPSHYRKPTHQPEGPVTTTLVPEPKTTTPTSSPQPAAQADGLEPAARIPADRVEGSAPVTPDRQGPPALLVEHVTKRFKVDRKKPPVIAIEDVSLRMERGAIHGVLGANGSGKSTLIRLISGLLTLDEGKVEVFGHDIERDELAVKRLINRVSVDAAFFKKLSPMENLLFAARLYGLDAGVARRQATEILGRLGIAENRLGRPVEQMSRGMQQKVAIARALLTSPTLLLLDEPTTGLDPRSKLDVQAFIEEVNQAHRRHDRPHDARPGRGGAPVHPDHDPRRGSRGCRGHARGAQATRRRGPRATADPRVRVHDLHRPLPRRGRRGRRRRHAS